MNSLFSFAILLAAVGCVISKPSEKLQTCIQNSGITTSQALDVYNPDFQPSPSFFCYMGCYVQYDYNWDQEGADDGQDDKLKKCAEDINVMLIDDDVEERCIVGEQLYKCGKEAGAFIVKPDPQNVGQE